MFQLDETARKKSTLEKLAKKLGLDVIPEDLIDEFGKLQNSHQTLPLEQIGQYNGKNWKVKDFLEFLGYVLPEKEFNIETHGKTIDYRSNGRTRAIYEGEHPNLEHKDTIKVTFLPLGLDSVATQINLTNYGVNENEMQHNNQSNRQTRTKARYKLGDHIEITIEDSLQGKSLEELVYDKYHNNHHHYSLGEPYLFDHTISHIIKDVVDIVSIYNERKDTLIRDITAGNFVYDGNETILVDKQNAIKTREQWKENLPTRGGTPYTHPHTLLSQYNRAEINPEKMSFGNKKLDEAIPSHANPDKRTEVYSVGALTYYLLTGKHAFNYKLDFATEEQIQSGKTKLISLKNVEGELEQRHVVLKDGDEVIESIDMIRHNKKLKKLVKELSDEYQKIVYKSLIVEPHKEYRTISQFEKDFRVKDVPLGKQIAQKLWKGVKGASIAAGVGLFLSGIYFLDRWTGEPKEPSQYEINQMKTLQSFRHLTAPKVEIDSMYSVLEKSVLENQERIMYVISNGEFGRKWNKNIPPGLTFNMAFRANRDFESSLNAKIRMAISYTCVMTDSTEMNNYYESIGDERTRHFYVSKEWFDNSRYAEGGLTGANTLDDMFWEEEYYIARATANRTEVDKSVEETMARYFLPTQEIDKAKITSGSGEYFDSYNDETKTFIQGYRHAIPEVMRETIDLAVAMYHLSDDMGEYHCDVIDGKLTGVNQDVKGFPEFLNVKYNLFDIAENYHVQKQELK